MMEPNIMKKITLLLTFVLLSSLFLVSCSNDTNDNKEEANTKEVSQDKEKQEEKTEKKEAEKKEELPKESQAVTEFPWDEDADFKEALEENNTDVLIAGFSTVFDDSTPEEFENIELASSIINGTVVKPGEVFSQNETAGPYTEERGYKEGLVYVGGEAMLDYGGGVCNVATTLYNTSIASDIDIVERHNHSMPVPYVPYGQDAAVAYGYKDFKFKNNTDDPMLIWTELKDNRLYMGFYGKEAAPEVVWEHETLSETETTTKYEDNPELNEGEEKVIVDGMDGKVVESVLKIKDEDGEEKVKEIGQSNYNPLMNIIERNEQ